MSCHVRPSNTCRLVFGPVALLPGMASGPKWRVAAQHWKSPVLDKLGAALGWTVQETLTRAPTPHTNHFYHLPSARRQVLCGLQGDEAEGTHRSWRTTSQARLCPRVTTGMACSHPGPQSFHLLKKGLSSKNQLGPSSLQVSSMTCHVPGAPL